MASSTAKTVDPRRTVVEALMSLAAARPYEEITLGDIAREAGLPLVDLRDLYPSKGAILGGVLRLVDRAVLQNPGADMAGESAHDRVLDVMMRRFDALAPYKEALRSVKAGLRRDPVSALAFNQAALNSWRYMLEEAGIGTNGTLGMVKIQGAVLVFARAFEVWLDDEPDLARTMAVLDRELKRGETVLNQAEALHRLAAPFRGFARALCQRGRERREERQARRNPGFGEDEGSAAAT